MGWSLFQKLNSGRTIIISYMYCICQQRSLGNNTEKEQSMSQWYKYKLKYVISNNFGIDVENKFKLFQFECYSQKVIKSRFAKKCYFSVIFHPVCPVCTVFLCK